MLTKSDFCFLLTTNSLAVTFKGKTTTLPTSDKRCQSLLTAIKEERWDDVPSLLKPEEAIPALSKGQMQVRDGQVFVRGERGEFAVPYRLNNTILDYMDKGLPFDPLVKFAVKLNENPSHRSVNQLFDFIEHNHFTITEDGNFIAYKGVRSNFTDCHTGTFDNSVGKVVSMSRNEVDDDPQRTCSAGLHASSFEYANTHFAQGDNILLYVEVDPADVVSVPVDYQFAKLRVCKYKVLGTTDFEFKENIHTTITSTEYSDEISDEVDECGPDCNGDCCDEEDETPKLSGCGWGVDRFGNFRLWRC